MAPSCRRRAPAKLPTTPRRTFLYTSRTPNDAPRITWSTAVAQQLYAFPWITFRPPYKAPSLASLPSLYQPHLHTFHSPLATDLNLSCTIRFNLFH